MKRLAAPLDAEQRESVRVLVALRWLLVAAAVFLVDYRPGTSPRKRLSLNLLIAGAGVFNAVLHVRLRRGRTIPAALPVVASVYDGAAVTSAVALVDRFTNPFFVLYYPSLLALSVAYPGRISTIYGGSVISAYAAISAISKTGRFSVRASGDQKRLVARLVTMGATVFAANAAVRIERDRRLRAVAAESKRAEEVRLLEARAVELERAAERERRRLVREVHDGIAQGVYSVSLGLEAVSADMAEDPAGADVAARVSAISGLARQTLLETRGLLFDLDQVMAGDSGLATLVRNQAREFEAITGIKAVVAVLGDERRLNPRTIGEVYRVLQAGLGNVHRHSKAASVELGVDFGDEALRVWIADDGLGFAGGENPRGLGLRTMRQRAVDLGGAFSVDSGPGRGTRLTLIVPWKEAEHATDSSTAG